MYECELVDMRVRIGACMFKYACEENCVAVYIKLLFCVCLFVFCVCIYCMCVGVCV